MGARLAELAGKTKALRESQSAGKPLSRICWSRRSLELSFERVVLVSVVVGDDGIAANEVDQFGKNLLEVGLILQLLERDPMDGITERVHGGARLDPADEPAPSYRVRDDFNCRDLDDVIVALSGFNIDDHLSRHGISS